MQRTELYVCMCAHGGGLLDSITPKRISHAGSTKNPFTIGKCVTEDYKTGEERLQ